MSTHTQTLAAVSPNPTTGSILALDLGTTTGWALSPPGGPIASGTVSFRPSRYDGGGMRYLRFRNWLRRREHLLDDRDPGIEAKLPFFTDLSDLFHFMM